jgi:hypothetical protein
MTPIRHATPQYPPTSCIMSAATTSSDAFVALTLGRSANAIDLLVPSAPPVHAAPDLKARCFDFLSDLLVEHSLLFSSAELIAAFKHIPSSSYNATLEASSCCSDLRSAFFLVNNLVALGFRDHLGAPISISITPDASTRPSGISYFAFRSSVNPSTIDRRLSAPSFSFEFWLALPQTTLTPSDPPVDDVARRLNFTSPQPASPVRALTPATADDLYNLNSQEFAALGTTSGSDLLSDYATDCLSLFSATQLQNLVLRSVTAAPADPILSPRMTAVLTLANSSHSSYFGPLDFLDSQTAFDLIFPNPVPLLVTTSPTGASIDSLSLSVSLDKFLDTCKFQLFVPIFRSDYVGTFTRNDAASLQATVAALKKLSMSSRHPTSGAWVTMQPDEVFAAYSNLIPLLPSNVSVWGLNLVTQFFDSLSLELQDALHIDSSYTPPDLSTLVTRSSQLDALRCLRVAAVRQHTLLRNQEKLIAKTVNRKIKHIQPPTALAAPASVIPPRLSPSASSPALSVSFDAASNPTRSFMSPAEETMRRYQPASSDAPTDFPIDPATNFQSTYPRGFPGCMFCGDSNHVFRQCPDNSKDGASSIFYRNLFAHKPHLRKRPPLPQEILPPPTPGVPPTQSFVSGPTLSLPPAPAVPALLPPAPSSVASPPPAVLPLAPSPSSLKRIRYFLLNVKSFSTHLPTPAPILPPMPIAIDNGLPHITFDLGAAPSLVELRGLMDTCGALNTGYLLFHLWLKSERPDLVADFVSFDDSNPFEPIKLGGAIRDPSDFVSADHGNLTAVIRYYTPYVDTSGSPITISFALGSDVTVNTIFGLPMLCDLDSVISLRSNTMHSRTLHRDFPITRAAASFGLPSDCSFDPAAASRHHDASLCGPPPSSAASTLAFDSPAPVLATATDDTSLGFLKRTVHATS